jgi:hypothetical protein
MRWPSLSSRDAKASGEGTGCLLVITGGPGFAQSLRVWGDFTGEDSGVLGKARIK